MTTRMTGKRETLAERVDKRWRAKNLYTGMYRAEEEICHVRAELQRVARQVRKLYQTEGQFYGDGTCVRRADVLALLREAGR